MAKARAAGSPHQFALLGQRIADLVQRRPARGDEGVAGFDSTVRRGPAVLVGADRPKPLCGAPDSFSEAAGSKGESTSRSSVLKVRQPTGGARNADPASVLGVDPSRLTMPHAVLGDDAILLAWHPGVQKADVDATVPFSAFVPALTDAEIASIQSIELASGWKGESQTVSPEGNGFRISVKGADGFRWMGFAPVLDVIFQGGRKRPVALFAKNINVDSRRSDEPGVRHNIETFALIAEDQRRRRATLERRVRFPERFIPSTEPLVTLDAELATVREELTLRRASLREGVEADRPLLATSLAELVKTNAAPETLASFEVARSLEAAGAPPRIVTDFLEGKKALDPLLLWAEPKLVPGTSEFGAKAERLYALENFEVPAAQRAYNLDRAQMMQDSQEKLTDLEELLADTIRELDANAEKLLGLPARPPESFSTHHKPYVLS